MASQKITQLTAATTAAANTLLPFVEDPGGTPLTKKITKEDIGIPLSVKLTGDLASTNVTTNVTTTGLLFPVTSGNWYRFQFTVVFQSGVTTTGLRLSLNVPSITTLAATMTLPNTSSTTITRITVLTSDTQASGVGVPVINVDQIATIDGVILPSANGNLQVQHASEIAATSVTIRTGSNGLLWKI